MDFAQMLFQVEIPAKAFGTARASKGFLLLVGEHVELQVVRVVEGLKLGFFIIESWFPRFQNLLQFLNVNKKYIFDKR